MDPSIVIALTIVGSLAYLWWYIIWRGKDKQ
jgi:hypothetical protein